LPAICLIVSGGHTLLYHVQAGSGKPGAGCTYSAPEDNASARGFLYRRLGGTRDDAAGEAYDKVARLLALGYPGGPVIDQLAAQGTACVPVANAPGAGCTRRRHSAGFGASATCSPPKKDGLHFGPVKIKGNPYDFSFSGIKTAVLYYLRAHPEFSAEIEARRVALQEGRRKAADLLPLCTPQTLSLVSNFQAAVVHDLVTRTLAAAAETGARTILVSGGVAANSQLRDTFASKSAPMGLNVFFPSRALSTDNAAMIAAAAYPHLLAGDVASSDLNAEPNLRLA
jgi:N6-L-threonylcarbamoyladenine synthase